MGSRRVTRRRAVETAGVAVFGGVLGMASSAVAESGWTRVTSGTDNTLTGVEYTTDEPHASGASGEILRRERDGGWNVAVQDGPSGNSKTLNAASVTGDKERYWVCGASGTIGEYEVSSGTMHDHSQPMGISNEFSSLFVGGEVGNEHIYVGESSGTVLVGTRADDGGIDWTLSDTGSGYTVRAIDFSNLPEVGFVATTGGEVYRTDDAGDSWTDVGVDDSLTGYTAVHCDKTGPEFVYTGGGGGRILRRDCDCDRWTPSKAGDERVYSLESNGDDDRYLGAGGSGRCYERESSAAGWEVSNTPTGNALLAAEPGPTDDHTDILVGKSGTVMER